MFVKQSSNPYKIRKKIYKHFYKQNKYQQFAGIFSFAKQLVEKKIIGNVYVQKRGKVYQYQFAIVSIDGKRKYKNKSGFRTKSEAIEEAKSECQRLGLETSPANIVKIRLWLEQDKTCIYSGTIITDDMIKRDNEVEKGFIIPLSRSLDSSYNNQVLAIKKVNVLKGNKLPYEAFDKDKFEKVCQLAKDIIQKKNYAKYRKLTTKFFEDRELGQLAKHLNDTSHIACLIRDFLDEFLEFAPLKKDKKKHIITPSGALKSAMRFYMGLGKKEMGTYYRYAIDACVVCLCNDATIQKFSEFKRDLDMSIYEQTSNELKIAMREQDYKIKHGFVLGKKYRENILNVISKVFVSHKVEGRIRGELHNQTIYSKKNLSGKEQEAINSGKKILIRGGFADNANGSMKRLDIFRDKQTGRYYGCPIYLMDYANKKLPNRVFIGSGKQQDINDNLEFCFSLTRNNLISVKSKNMSEPVFCYFNSYNISNNTIEIKTHDKKFDNFSDDEAQIFNGIDYKTNKRGGFGIVLLSEFKKMWVNVLGEIVEEKFIDRQPI